LPIQLLLGSVGRTYEDQTKYECQKQSQFIYRQIKNKIIFYILKNITTNAVMPITISMAGPESIFVHRTKREHLEWFVK